MFELREKTVEELRKLKVQLSEEFMIDFADETLEKLNKVEEELNYRKELSENNGCYEVIGNGYIDTKVEVEAIKVTYEHEDDSDILDDIYHNEDMKSIDSLVVRVAWNKILNTEYDDHGKKINYTQFLMKEAWNEINCLDKSYEVQDFYHKDTEYIDYCNDSKGFIKLFDVFPIIANIGTSKEHYMTVKDRTNCLKKMYKKFVSGKIKSEVTKINKKYKAVKELNKEKAVEQQKQVYEEDDRLLKLIEKAENKKGVSLLIDRIYDMYEAKNSKPNEIVYILGQMAQGMTMKDACAGTSFYPSNFVRVLKKLQSDTYINSIRKQKGLYLEDELQ